MLPTFPFIQTEYDAGVVIPILQIRKLRFRESTQLHQVRVEPLLTQASASALHSRATGSASQTWVFPGPVSLSPFLLAPFQICSIAFILWVISSVLIPVLISSPLDSSQLRSHCPYKR